MREGICNLQTRESGERRSPIAGLVNFFRRSGTKTRIKYARCFSDAHNPAILISQAEAETRSLMKVEHKYGAPLFNLESSPRRRYLPRPD